MQNGKQQSGVKERKKSMAKAGLQRFKGDACKSAWDMRISSWPARGESRPAAHGRL